MDGWMDEWMNMKMTKWTGREEVSKDGRQKESE
jgi:hypothetical protein